MHLTQYHPSIRRLQEDFAARIARRKYTAGRGPRPPKGKITDNSEPWLANPDSVSDDWYIACKVSERVETGDPFSQAILEGRKLP
ncbi:MAG: hypothetical protein V4584_11385 [Verrucomicrobiota bacterium]